MRNHNSGRSGLDHTGEQLLRELDLLQAGEPAPDIGPPPLIDQAVRNMARRELANSPVAPLAGTLRWIAGLATVSIALIAVGISMVQSPPYVPPPAGSALKSEQKFDTPLESPAASGLAKERSAIPAAPESEPSAAGHTGADQAFTTSSPDADVPADASRLEQQATDPSRTKPAVESMSATEVGKTNLADEISDLDETRGDSAQAWLERIRQLHDQGLLTEAAGQLRAFGAEYPEYPLPDWAAEIQP